MCYPKTTLLLSLETFSSQGGIQCVSRVLAKALSERNRLVVYSLRDAPHQVDSRYLAPSVFHAYSGQKLRFFFKALVGSAGAEALILTHVNLLVLALTIKLFNPKIHIILFAHGVEVWRPLPGWKRWFMKKYIKTWAVSHFTAEQLESQIGSSRHPIRVFNNCLDPFFKIPHQLSKPKHLEDRYKLKPNDRVLFCLSRLSAYDIDKGYDKLLFALPALLLKHPNIIYLLAGKASKSEATRLQTLIITLGLQEHVILAGPIAAEELTDHYLLADAFVLCSIKEGFGLAFIEAAACGCPIICGNMDGSLDAVLNGEMAALIHPQDIAQLEQAVLDTLERPGSKLKQQQKCLQHFGYEQYVDRLNTLLRSTLFTSVPHA